MSNYELIEVNINNLVVNNANPRYDEKDNESDAINYLVSDQSKKLLNLSDDIIENGLNPSDIIITTPLDRTNNSYLVLEGNRRITAIKLILNPNLISNNNKLRERFLDLKSKLQKLDTNLNNINTIVFKNEQDAIHWLKLKHSGEQKGVGTVKWNSQSKRRFKNKYEKDKDYCLRLISLYKKYENLSIMKKKQLDSIAITNLERLINDPYVRDFVGLKLENSNILIKYPREEVLKTLRVIFDDLCERKIQVNTIYSKQHRIEYVDSIKSKDRPDSQLEFPTHIKFNYSTIPDFSITKNHDKDSLQNNLFDTIDNSKNKKNNKQHSNNTNKTTKNPVTDKLRTSASSNNSKIKSHNTKISISKPRKFLIPKESTINIENPRIRNLYVQLKGINIHHFTDIIAVSFRIFLELSLDYFIIEKDLDCQKYKDSLSKKLTICKNYLKEKGLLDRNQIKPINIAISNDDSILSIDTLHSYIHNSHMQPFDTNLIKHWDNFEPFFEALYHEIAKN